MAFIAWLVQAGEGCDYTIGCGLSLIRLKAKTKEEAKKELHHNLVFADGDEDLDYGPYREDNKLEKVTLFEVSDEYEIPIARWYEEYSDCEEIAEGKEAERKEKEQFERLKAKYEKGDA